MAIMEMKIPMQYHACIGYNLLLVNCRGMSGGGGRRLPVDDMTGSREMRLAARNDNADRKVTHFIMRWSITPFFRTLNTSPLPRIGESESQESRGY